MPVSNGISTFSCSTPHHQRLLATISLKHIQKRDRKGTRSGHKRETVLAVGSPGKATQHPRAARQITGSDWRLERLCQELWEEVGVSVNPREPLVSLCLLSQCRHERPVTRRGITMATVSPKAPFDPHKFHNYSMQNAVTCSQAISDLMKFLSLFKLE